MSPLPLIVIGDVDGSYLAQKMLADPIVAIEGERMPDGYTGTPEQDADINTILAWISGGEFECEAAASTGSESTSTTGEPGPRACGLEDLAPGTQSLIDVGTAIDEVPPDIATILEGNCGCHYTNVYPELPPYIDYQEGTQPLDMTSIAGFRKLNGAMMPVPYYEVTLARLMGAGMQIAMPPPDPHCNAMPSNDYDTLVEWLTAGAPDGATWMPAPASSHVCGIEDLKPGAPNPIVAGDGMDVIPTDIGEILANNCGCHYADDLTAPDADQYDYGGVADLATHAGFQAMSGDTPLHALALEYVTIEFMPFEDVCIQADGEKLTGDDFRTLVQWLSAGAPDGATWQPD